MFDAVKKFNYLLAEGNRLLRLGCLKDALDQYALATRVNRTLNPRSPRQREIFNRMAHCHLDLAEKLTDVPSSDFRYHCEQAGLYLSMATGSATDQAYNKSVQEHELNQALPPANFQYAFMLSERLHKLEKYNFPVEALS